MPNQETKRQHFVPRVYLKNFAKKYGDKWLIDSVNMEDPSHHFSGNIDDVCVKKNFYTLTGGTEKERQAIENFYQDIETKYDSVYSKLVDTNIREIEDEEKQIIIAFLTTLLFRNLSWVERYNEFVERSFRKAYALCNQHGKKKFNYLGKQISFENQDFEEVLDEHLTSIKDGQVSVQVDVALRLSQLRAEDEFFVTELGEENSNFVTSDNPVVIQSESKGYVMPFDPENILSLPLNNKFLLYLMPSSISPIKIKPNYIARDQKTDLLCRTEELTANFLQIRNTNRFLLGEKKFIDKALEQKKINDSFKDFKRPKSLTEFAEIAKKIGLIE